MLCRSVRPASRGDIMTPFRRGLAWTAAVLTVCATGTPSAAAPAPVGASESPLAIVPAQAPIVVHLRGVERTRDRLAKLLKDALPDLGPAAADRVDELLKTGLEGRKLQGLDPAG